ncbi:hypothetical protein HanXRQr2_Chr14g0649501 [Helianthus annuus]|uniref:Uncharacterized protein n=1 Tax=Helianthus annuus TaxID=4232 RepID=A0A9K3H880_HELAN|nr:hypothetical protein HanXRQr2_Chr14g0649501 [Helianthus annuus]KAJ0840797.1 hypothetical protein HanPSC8_Chr14g0623101 [Helianthus annuus]
MILRTIYRVLRPDLLCMGINTHAVCKCKADAHRQEIESLRAFCWKHTHTLESLHLWFCKHCACNRNLHTY